MNPSPSLDPSPSPDPQPTTGAHAWLEPCAAALRQPHGGTAAELESLDVACFAAACTSARCAGASATAGAASTAGAVGAALVREVQHLAAQIEVTARSLAGTGAPLGAAVAQQAVAAREALWRLELGDP